MSRVIYKAAIEASFPKALNRVHASTGVPGRSLQLLFGLSLVSLVLFYFLNVDLQTELLIPSGAAILVYIIGSASGIRLLGKGGVKTLFPWISLAVSLAMLPFVGPLLIVSLTVASVGLVYNRRQVSDKERVSDS